jgi:hypothetical protein
MAGLYQDDRLRNTSESICIPVAEQKSYAVTDGLSDADEPKFDPKGKYLYFFASTDAGPVLNWFDQSNIDMRQTNAIVPGDAAKGDDLAVCQGE